MNILRMAIPGLLATLALAGCGSDTTETTKTIAVDLCVETAISCEDTTGRVSCDPTDGVCKCGGRGGVVCGPGMVCDLDLDAIPPSATCVSERCVDVVCNPFETCDAADGLCKCDGEPCGDGRTCLADGCSDEDPCAGVVCADDQACDPSDRICKCGGSICSVGERCSLDGGGVAYCVGRKCVGKNCADGTVCNPVDGLCHCGSANGDVCTIGQACLEEDGESVCVGNDICEGVVCSGHTVCSPFDGLCRCGGFEATAPVCADDQTCDLHQAPPRCVGGDACAGVVCETGTNLSCDGETGECSCGGTGGLACDPGQGCIDAGGKPTCVNRCDPNAPNVAISVCGQVKDSVEKGCYLSPANGLAYCADAGGETEGSNCESPTDCVAGHHCVQSDTTSRYGTCRRYCDLAVLDSCRDPERACKPLSVQTIGVCIAVVP